MMKNPSIFLLLLVFCMASCQEDDPLKSMKLPKWLTEKIQDDEEYVSQNPMSMLAHGVWVSVEWRGNIYFEYSNLLSSGMFSPISFEGDTLPFYILDSNTLYFNEKCCSKLIWHGNKIDEEYLKLFHGD